MTGDEVYDRVLVYGLVFVVLAALGSAIVKTPYGRFASTSFGPSVPIRWGWLLMEAPALPVYAWVLARSPHGSSPFALACAALWALHYLNRALVFPLTMRSRPDGRMALLVVGMGAGVAATHAWLYATWTGWLTSSVGCGRLLSPPFVVGAGLWAMGFALILSSEEILRGLRRDGETGYAIPRGAGFAWVSSPHYLGEILAWSGMWLATGAAGGAFVLGVTLANLVPRAAATHAWYKQTFADYPTNRRALVPWLW